MYYIIQENTFREQNYEVLKETLDRFKFDYNIVRVFPFVDKVVDINDIKEESFNVDDLPDFKTNRKDVFVFGSLKLARVAADLKWYPGSMMNQNHDYLVYKDFYKENLLNYDSKIVEFASDFEWGNSEFRFIRPTKDTKVFAGKVYSESDWKEFVKYSLENGHTTILTEKTEIQVSSPKTIQKEIRFWIVGGNIITGSQYRLGNMVLYDENYDQGALEFARKMIDLFELNEAFVMDVCLVNDQWKIVECGCINCAGFYKADMQKLIMALEDYFN